MALITMSGNWWKHLTTASTQQYIRQELRLLSILVVRNESVQTHSYVRESIGQRTYERLTLPVVKLTAQERLDCTGEAV